MTLALHVSRTVPAKRDRVFAAWTSPAQLQQWFGPRGFSVPKANVDLREGGDYRLEMKSPDGNIIHLHGTYREVRAPERLVSRETPRQSLPSQPYFVVRRLRQLDPGIRPESAGDAWTPYPLCAVDNAVADRTHAASSRSPRRVFDLFKTNQTPRAHRHRRASDKQLRHDGRRNLTPASVRMA
jgi:uncharacterized protein YndB with AHSA1/START domain